MTKELNKTILTRIDLQWPLWPHPLKMKNCPQNRKFLFNLSSFIFLKIFLKLHVKMSSYFNISFTGINEEVKKTAFAVYWVFVKAICRCRVKLKHIIGKIKIHALKI